MAAHASDAVKEAALGPLTRGEAIGAVALADPGEELAGSATPATVPLHLLTSTFLAPDGDAALLVLTPARAEMDPEGGRALLAALEAAYAEAQAIIPELEAEGQALADESLEQLDDRGLAEAIERRADAVRRWKKTYWDEFIPFAHGVRQLGTYYNDAVKPEDPYEFIGLLRDQPLVARQRNAAMGRLAQQLAASPELLATVQRLIAERGGALHWPAFRDVLMHSAAGAEDFVRGFEELNRRFLDIAFDQERLHDQHGAVLRNLVELSQVAHASLGDDSSAADVVAALEQRLLNAVGRDRRDEALAVIETGRLSWRLRDDDNLLVARLESQLLRALDVAAQRLRATGRLRGAGRPNDAHVEAMIRVLRDPAWAPVTLEPVTRAQAAGLSRAASGETPRQLIGQPASPGCAAGTVRCIHGRGDLGAFRHGEVLVCDAIQPTMTHLVPLASAIVERRGGMLIHGAIIARELGIPCVNGVRDAAEILHNGDLVTVDGHLGIVTVGAAEFDLELGGESP